MKNDPGSTTPDVAAHAKALTQVLGQSEQVKLLVEECADELSSANRALKEEVAGQKQLSGIDDALEKTEAIEGKVLEAADVVLPDNNHNTVAALITFLNKRYGEERKKR